MLQLFKYFLNEIREDYTNIVCFVLIKQKALYTLYSDLSNASKLTSKE